MTPPDAQPNTTASDIHLTITHHSNPIPLTFPHDASISDLSTHIATTLSIPPAHQKFLITPKLGLLKPPFKNPSLPLSSLVEKKILLMGSTTSEISSLNARITAATAPRGPTAKPTPYRDAKRTAEESTYTFHTLRPLPYLPNPERSLQFLKRLAADAGIKAAMRTHRFSVPLLTEMDPAMHTTHESRTLGLNRNKGEVIELRLRTDAGDGYRDYKTIRRTLCHELAHCVWGEHDRNFWELCRRIEGEVERGDWRGGGRSVDGGRGVDGGAGGGEEGEEEEVFDHGGWEGGEYVLGGRKVDEGGETVRVGGVSRREVLARAAEERRRREGSGEGEGK